MKKIKILITGLILSISVTAAYAECIKCVVTENPGKCYDSKCSKSNESGTECCGNTISVEEEVNP